MAVERSQIKFAKSPQTGEIIGFVSRHPKNKRLIGVEEKSPYGKKICVLSEDLKGKVKPGITYSVDLKPMHNGQGYVVVSADEKRFPAEIKLTVVPHAIYQATVTFGYKTIYFDPKDGASRKSKTFAGALQAIRSRNDIENQDEVVEEFRKAANELLRIMERDGYFLNNEPELFPR